jgi:hypothetical protein
MLPRFDLLNSSYFDKDELKKSVFVQCIPMNSIKLFFEKTKFKIKTNESFSKNTYNKVKDALKLDKTLDVDLINKFYIHLLTENRILIQKLTEIFLLVNNKNNV